MDKETLKTFLAVLLWMLSIIVMVWLLTGCAGLPTVVPTFTPPATLQPTLTPTPDTGTPTPESAGNVTITGNVWLRDGVGNKVGYLLAGVQVNAVCDGDWCALADGLKFWRGCSDNNPAGLACRTEE